MKRTLIIAFFAVLFVAHQDFWWRNDPTLVFGVLPISLAYHVVWTLLVAFGWFLVAKFFWPDRLDEVAEPAAPTTPAPTRNDRPPPR